MSLYTQLCELIDAQDSNALDNFLVEHPELDLNQVTQTGLSALWYAMYPEQNKNPSAPIIELLIQTGRIDTSQTLYQQSLRHIATSTIRDIVEANGNPWQAPEHTEQGTPQSPTKLNIENKYQLFSAKVLNELMQHNLPLFNKYLYHYQLKGLPLGAPELAPTDEEIQLWVHQQHQAFAQEENISLETVLALEPVHHRLSDDQFFSLQTLKILAQTMRLRSISHIACLLRFEPKPLIDVLNMNQPIADLLATLHQQLTDKLAPQQYLAEMQNSEFIKQHMDQLPAPEKPAFAKKLWGATLNLIFTTHEVNNEKAFLSLLTEQFNEHCPALNTWITHLNTEEKFRFFKEYFQTNALLQKEALRQFAPYWALSNQCVEHFNFNEPIKFQNQDFRGIDLSAIDLTSIEFNTCDLRLTQIADNPHLEAHHLEGNILEDALWSYACLNENITLINYFLNKPSALNYLNYRMPDSRIPLLIHLASQGLAKSIKAILAKNNSTDVLNVQNDEGETALFTAVLHNQTDVVATILAANHSPEVVHAQGNDAFSCALQLGNQNVIREFYRIDMTYPASYSKLYHNGDDALTNAKRMLVDYTKNDFRALRWLHGHFNRHHVAEVTSIIRKINSDEITDMHELLTELKKILLLNHTGSLARRIMYIEARMQANPLPDEDSEASCTSFCMS